MAKVVKAHDSVSAQRASWNAANLKRVTDVLLSKGYRSTKIIQQNGEWLEWFVGPGSSNLILVQRYADDMGFEVYTPLTTSNEMDVTVEALKVACTPIGILIS